MFENKLFLCEQKLWEIVNIEEKPHQIYQKYYSKILYKHIRSSLACLFMQTVFYANKTEKNESKSPQREGAANAH